MESRIKERLTGALILVAALVILVPEIFSGRRAAERALDAPPAAPATEGPPLRTYTAELGAATPPPLAATPPESAPAEAVASVNDAEATASPAPAAPPIAASPPTSSPSPSPSPSPSAAPAAEPEPRATAAGDWYVQVGSFSQAANAQRYAQQLRSQGYSAAVLPPAGSKSLSRVRVGPARTREAAGQLQQRLAAGGHKGAVVGP